MTLISKQRPIDRVHGVTVYSHDDLVPVDNRVVNPKPRVQYRDYVQEQNARKWNQLQKAHWQTCKCPVCGKQVIFPDWTLHALTHTLDLIKIGLLLEWLMQLFNYDDDEAQETLPQAA